MSKTTPALNRCEIATSRLMLVALGIPKTDFFTGFFFFRITEPSSEQSDKTPLTFTASPELVPIHEESDHSGWVNLNQRHPLGKCDKMRITASHSVNKNSTNHYIFKTRGKKTNKKRTDIFYDSHVFGVLVPQNVKIYVALGIHFPGTTVKLGIFLSCARKTKNLHFI